MGEFKKNNPGVAETIEGSGTDTQQTKNTGNQKSPAPTPGQKQTLDEQGPGTIGGWISNLWKSLWGTSTPAPVSRPAPQSAPEPVRTGAETTAAAVQMTDATGAGYGTFILTSSAGPDEGTLPIENTCDGSGASPALSWSGAPAGTKEYALMMTTLPVDGSTRWNWIIYGIPGNVTGLAKSSTGVGTTGTGSHGTVMQYDPPCSQGPGAKVYTFTLYALSASPALPLSADKVTGPVLTSAITPVTLGKASFSLSYTR
jgi:phosphatidylethanolamine-binding protein (PEBP) family uncharacterized protein